MHVLFSEFPTGSRGQTRYRIRHPEASKGEKRSPPPGRVETGAGSEMSRAQWERKPGARAVWWSFAYGRRQLQPQDAGRQQGRNFQTSLYLTLQSPPCGSHWLNLKAADEGVWVLQSTGLSKAEHESGRGGNKEQPTSFPEPTSVRGTVSALWPWKNGIKHKI